MTAEELLKDLETCTGPCGRMCMFCPESRYVGEIHEVVKQLIDENKKLREALRAQTGEVDML